MNAEQRTIKLVNESIARNMAKHVVTVRRIDGLYRHYRCQNPMTWNFGFDIVTWPGYLCFAGDLGEYVFQRVPDMIDFMGKVCRSNPIDYRYAAEKCRASRWDLKEFSEQRFRSVLRERLREGRYCDVFTYGGKERIDVKEKLREIASEFEEHNKDPSVAVRAMYESDLWDGTDLPNCQTWTFQFVLCIHAIRWFCERLESGRLMLEVAA
ncbi:MAG: hypothetical protein KGL39_34560 [Patescibacteria group bacterium]|nr:hypothetical protein [Patescibacteria group bacterium]